MLRLFIDYPFLRLLIPLLAGILCGDAFPRILPLWIYPPLLLSLFMLAWFSHWFRLRWLYGAGVHLFFFCLGYMLVGRQLEQTDYTFSGNPSVCKVRICEKPEVKERSILCRAVLTEEFRTDGSSLRASCDNLFLLYFSKDSIESGLRQGAELLIYTRLYPPYNNGNPDEFDYASYLRHKGVTGTAYVASGHWRVIDRDSHLTFRQRALECREKVVALYHALGFKGDVLAVLSALTVGDKEELSDDIAETYSVAGASHVLALSGLHIGLIYALFLFVFAPLWKRWAWLKPFLLLFILVFLWGFAFLTGLSSSVVRSVIMFSLLALACLQPEKPLTLNTLAATAFLMLLYNPFWLFDVGFQLSFVAVASILAVQPKLYMLWKVKNRFLRYGWGLVTVSIAAQIGTAPLVMLYFSRFSTHFLLTNLWVIPMVSLILYSSVILLVLTPLPSLQFAFSSVVGTLVHIQNEVLRWIEHLPLSSIDGIWMDACEVLLYYLLVGLIGYSLLRRTARSVLLALFFLLSLVSYHAVSVMLYAPRKSMVFYNVRGCPAVHCMAESGRSWLVCADSLPEVSRLSSALSPYWNRLHLERPQLVTGRYISDCLSMQGRMLCYVGTSVCFLHDDSWTGKTAIRPMSVDYLYISKGYAGGIKELSPLFSPRTVVLDASLSVHYQEKIISECIHLGIPYLSLSEKGSVRILL
ncbi:ComEC/Rec2 family competence protein [Bacteroides helcogenes]|uniref:ComEC/Rec2-related protein n=1 Tax=Bacteroides helcogenes (strain ATCC 35417 / DSM 20613 / JCM 6297 / CCUG 15421 / P 36-108) TaxID=693979 RepID=E6SR70_BACT6|nr:ComEC/Rec2 family competence protein [Bacteroides helcogenes]ADV42074.1 ComEC/Rec2-related protein [Bacteroides helcogenes P 36-108]MDY5240021.1 ComEC/Rec2 family competence protein [Bacteroides helcogenes]